MLTYGEINSRERACVRCRGMFKIAGPLDGTTRSALASLMDSGQPIKAIQLIRERTASGLAEAKATYEHLTLEVGRCQWCKASIPVSDYVDCHECHALNIDVRALANDV